MTIAACYLSPEGVVFGADSTTSMVVPGGTGEPHYFNFGQKLFEFGEEATVGVVTWGMGSLGDTSYRTLIAEVADEASPDCNLDALVSLWITKFWGEYSRVYAPNVTRARDLAANQQRNQAEEEELGKINQSLSVGFCIGGRRPDSRKPRAVTMLFGPTQSSPPAPQPVPSPTNFWGVPNLIQRLLFGIDSNLFSQILASGKWSGTQNELMGIVQANRLGHPQHLPLREAIDYVYASIYTTIKSLKFSCWQPVCGGPIEIAVISSDRKFRWVKHKNLDEAI